MAAGLRTMELVYRRLTSLALAFALLFASAGACLACANLLTTAKSHECCDKTKTNCPRPQEKAPVHEHCAAAAAPEAAVPLAPTAGVDSAEPVVLHGSAAEVLRPAAVPMDSPPVAVTPDLCILHSVLRV